MAWVQLKAMEEVWGDHFLFHFLTDYGLVYGIHEKAQGMAADGLGLGEGRTMTTPAGCIVLKRLIVFEYQKQKYGVYEKTNSQQLGDSLLGTSHTHPNSYTSRKLSGLVMGDLYRWGGGNSYLVIFLEVHKMSVGSYQEVRPWIIWLCLRSENNNNVCSISMPELWT